MKLKTKNHKLKTSGRGFTIFEILIGMGILAVIFAIGLPISWNFYINYQFDSEVDTFVSVLEQARNSAMVNRNESPHGVYADANQFVIFQGVNYTGRDVSQDKIFPRSGNVNLNGPSEIVFSALSGQVSSTTYSFSRAQRSSNVYVNSEGAISF